MVFKCRSTELSPFVEKCLNKTRSLWGRFDNASILAAVYVNPGLRYILATLGFPTVTDWSTRRIHQ